MRLIPRPRHLERVLELLQHFPVVGLVGPRQVGKSTLARMIAERWEGPCTRFDLEDPRDEARLADPVLALERLEGLVILDEIQHLPDLFRVLRVLADRPHRPARFLVLGSAGPDLLRQSSESLAGRIAYHELTPLRLDEVGAHAAERLWVRGGFPPAFASESDAMSSEWRRQFVRTFLERDLPRLGAGAPPDTMRRLGTMLAHAHGETLNSARLAGSLGVSDTSIRRYLDALTSALVVRRLRPWHANLGKRQVRAPKIYVSDTGLLHALLALDTLDELEGHPKAGASWESFALLNTVDRLGVRWDEDAYFWATHAGAEIDLVVMRGRHRLGFEVKRTVAPTVTRSMRIAMEDLELERIDVLYAGGETYPMAERIRAVPVRAIWQEIHPL